MSWRGSDGTASRNDLVAIIKSDYAKRDEIFGRAVGGHNIRFVSKLEDCWVIDERIFQSRAADRELDSLVDGGKNGLQHCVVTPALSMRRSLTWLKRTAVHLVVPEDRLVPMIPDGRGY